jgi:predicted AAA+ superfamily ATPase
LLEFVLEDHSFSMPVGRIEYLHLGPMTFEEFLLAMNRKGLREWMENWQISDPVPESMHGELLRLLRQYLVVGGMPGAVEAFAVNESYRECERVQQSILSTYRDDFGKYATRVQHRRVEKVFAGVPRLVGRKFMYSQIDRGERSRDLGQALHLLCQARVAYRVPHTHANGMPLAAEADDRNFKVLFLDVGMLSRSLGLNIAEVHQSDDPLLVNGGAVAEQFIGQHLLYSGESYEEPELHCWMRQNKSANAEIDYLQACNSTIVPVEVKAGKTGTLKSLHVFVQERECRFALRFNSDCPSLCDCQTALATGPRRSFRLLSLPLYMVGEARRLCRAVID